MWHEGFSGLHFPAGRSKIHMASPDSLPIQIQPPPDAQIAEQFRRDGYVVLEDVLPVDFVDQLRAEYERLLAAKVERFALRRAAPRPASQDRFLNDFKPEGGNHDRNRWNMHLPSALPFFDERLIANERVVALVDQILDPGWQVYLLASDTPYPGASEQSIHQDFSRLSLAVNVPLIDVTENDSPLEVWPGTHRPDFAATEAPYSKEPFLLTPEAMRHVVENVPSRRLLLRRGSLVVRDHRLVHRGTAHLGDRPRPVLSIYCVEPTPAPYRWLADLGARVALAARRVGRGRGHSVARPGLFNLGNLLGRVVEEASLSDRDYRRVVPADLWERLSPRARGLLRHARVERGAAHPPAGRGSLAGSFRFAGQWTGNTWEAVRSQLLGQPRRPDHPPAKKGASPRSPEARA